MGEYRPDKIIKEMSREFQESYGMVDLPIFFTSTVAFGSLSEFESADRGIPRQVGRRDNGTGKNEIQSPKATDYSYGPHANPTIQAVAKAVGMLERGTLDHDVATFLTPMGLSAITLVLHSLLEPGQAVLFPDSVYGPARRYAESDLRKNGITPSYYDPKTTPSDLEKLITDKTRMIWIESPGSATFEVQDTPEIVKVAKNYSITTVADNSWATPIYHRPLEAGVDIVIQALTKYMNGHANLTMGAIISRNPEASEQIATAYRYQGMSVSPFDAYMVSNGMQSLIPRLAYQQDSAQKVAAFLSGRPEVERVLYPAHNASEDYRTWQKLFSGATSLFGITLQQEYREHARQFVDSLSEFAIGASWGGPKSLALVLNPERTVKPCDYGPVVRLYIGLEQPGSLILDLQQALDRLH